MQKFMSRTLHDCVFEALGLPHSYELLETSMISNEIKLVLSFGSTLVTSLAVRYRFPVILDEVRAVWIASSHFNK